MSEPAVSSTPDSPPALTPRQQLKADRREALLAAAKHLIAKHGYLGVRLEDIGGAAGVSGPAVYRHFASKDAVLAALLVGISHTLRDGGQRVKQSAPSPSHATVTLLRVASRRPARRAVSSRDSASPVSDLRGRARCLLCAPKVPAMCRVAGPVTGPRGVRFEHI